MFKSIFTTALRNMARSQSFSAINLIGLSVSMSLALLVILLIREQYAYDDFHRDANRIYRVNTRALRTGGGSEDYASTPLPIGRILKENYTFIEDVVTVNKQFRGDVVYGNVNVPVEGLLVDPSFLKVFNFPLEKGSPATVLVEPNSLVITHETAHKVFGNANPLGQTIMVSGYGDFTVSGVLKPFPDKTHFEFGMLGSIHALAGLEQRGVLSSSQDNWNDYYSNYIYFKLKPGHVIGEAGRALASIARQQYKGLKLETRDRGYEFFTLALDELTPGPALSNQMGTGMPELLIVFLGALVGLVMLMACFNYTNLTIAKSISRAREIGVRKVVGAQRHQVFVQFIGEAVVFSLMCLVVSYGLLQALKPAFLQLNMAREFSAELNEDPALYIYFILFAIGVGAVAGLLPAGYLSAFRPVRVLKNSGNLKLYTRLTFRKILIATQFALSIGFIIAVLVIYRQINYMISMDYGIDDKHTLNVRLQGMDFSRLKNEVKSLPGVTSAGGVSHRLGTWADRSADYRKNPEDEPFVMRDFIVDDAYIDNLDIIFLSGRNFDAAEQGEREKHVILNEQALMSFDFSDPVSAIGETIYVDDSVMLTVIGVVKDFHFRPLSYQIGPVAFRYRNDKLAFLSMKIVPAQKEAIVASLESIWKKLDPVHSLEWTMMEDEIDDAYTRAGFLDVLKIVGYVAFLSVTLACLGMLGMAMYATQIRRKEIGIRKVMGASARQVTLLLSRSFMVLLAIGSVVGIPLGYFAGDQFLTTYAYRITISPVLLFTGIFIVGALGMLTICSQTWKAASSNPVQSLRYE